MLWITEEDHFAASFETIRKRVYIKAHTVGDLKHLYRVICTKMCYLKVSEIHF